jgi:hypothetical protein
MQKNNQLAQMSTPCPSPCIFAKRPDRAVGISFCVPAAPALLWRTRCAVAAPKAPCNRHSRHLTPPHVSSRRVTPPKCVKAWHGKRMIYSFPCQTNQQVPTCRCSTASHRAHSDHIHPSLVSSSHKLRSRDPDSISELPPMRAHASKATFWHARSGPRFFTTGTTRWPLARP